MMLFADPKDRAKADFFIELYPILTDRMVNKMPWYNRDHITDRFLHKYQNRLSGFKAITDFRKVKQHLNVARLAGQTRLIERRFHTFVEDDARDISYLEINVARIHRGVKNLVKLIGRLSENLASINIQEFIGEEEFWVELEMLHRQIARRFRDASRRVA
jgi:ParB family chromosome partitioning protein